MWRNHYQSIRFNGQEAYIDAEKFQNERELLQKNATKYMQDIANSEAFPLL